MVHWLRIVYRSINCFRQLDVYPPIDVEMLYDRPVNKWINKNLLFIQMLKLNKNKHQTEENSNICQMTGIL